MSDVDAEDLIARLSADSLPPIAPPSKAAETALATSLSAGEGSAYRVIARVWRQYFHPPTETGDFG